MFDEMVLYHSILVEILLGLLVISLAIIFVGDDYKKIVKRMRVYMFFFHGLTTTVAFSGLVAFVFAKMSFDLTILAMIVVYVALSSLESLKYLKILKKSKNIKEIRTIGLKYTAINILLIVVLIVWKIEEHSHAVPIS